MDVGDFSDGLALTYTNPLLEKRVAYINTEGKPFLVLDYLDEGQWIKTRKLTWAGTVTAGDFSEGLAPVRVFGKKYLSVHLGGD